MGVVYFSIIPTFEPSRYCKCWIVCFKYRNALGHAMRSNEHADREVFIGEIDKTPLIFTEDLFRQMRASLNEYQQVINLVENSFNQI